MGVNNAQYLIFQKLPIGHQRLPQCILWGSTEYKFNFCLFTRKLQAFSLRQKQKHTTAEILRLMWIEAEQSQKLDAVQNTKLKIKDI